MLPKKLSDLSAQQLEEIFDITCTQPIPLRALSQNHLTDQQSANDSPRRQSIEEHKFEISFLGNLEVNSKIKKWKITDDAFSAANNQMVNLSFTLESISIISGIQLDFSFIDITLRSDFDYFVSISAFPMHSSQQLLITKTPIPLKMTKDDVNMILKCAFCPFLNKKKLQK